MLGLLTAISVGFNAVVLAQLVAPGPAAPGGPYPYGIGPGGIRMAPRAGGKSTTTPLSVAPELMSVPRQARRGSMKRSKAAHVKHRKTRKQGAEVGKCYVSAKTGRVLGALAKAVMGQNAKDRRTVWTTSTRCERISLLNRSCF